MEKFTNIFERKDHTSLMKDEITSFINKVKRRVPAAVRDVILTTQKYNITSAETINNIKLSSKSSLGHLSDALNIPIKDLETLQKQLKDLGNNIKLLPQMMSQAERAALELGKLSMDDLTIDLESPSGRNAAAKMYMPLVYKIVNQFVNKSNLDKQSLISAGLEGFTDAMNNWRRESADGKNTVSFKTYVGYRVRQQILNDINRYSHAFSGGSSYVYSNPELKRLLDAISLDGIPTDENGEWKQDRVAGLGVQDTPNKDDREYWKQLYKLIESKFSKRDVDIFYRFFGLNGYKREKSKDIAKSYGMSEGNIRNSILNKMIKFLKQDKRAEEILSDIADIYNENLMVDMISLSRNMIIETLVNDEIYIVLEELTKWNTKERFIKDLIAALDRMDSEKNVEFIYSILNGGFEDVDKVIKKKKKELLDFLSFIYPTEKVRLYTDVDIIEKFVKLQEIYKKYSK